MVLLHVHAAGCFECVVVNGIYLPERLSHPWSRSFILTHHAAIVASRWIVKVSLHLVVSLLVHNQHQSLRFTRCTVKVMAQYWTQATVIIVSLHTTKK